MKIWALSMDKDAGEAILDGYPNVRLEDAEAIDPGPGPVETDGSGRHYLPWRPIPVPTGRPRLHWGIGWPAPDYLHLGLPLVSRAFREVAGLGPDARYFDIDATASNTDGFSRNYAALWPIADRTDWLDLDALNFGASRSFLDAPATPVADRVVFRADISPDVDIFRTRYFEMIFVTDRLAERLMQAGLTLAFHDYDQASDREAPLRRQL